MNTKILALLGVSCIALSACAPQSTPSLMNENRVQLESQTSMDQIPAQQVNDGYLSALAQQYNRYGEGPVELTMTFNPKSKSQTAMKSLNQLGSIAEKLRVKGVRHVKTATMPVEGDQPQMLLVSFDTVQAYGPADCAPMPGMEDYQTSRFVEEGYRFGCGIETQLARQIYRPADLKGVGTVDAIDGRRATSVSEYYRTVDENDIRGELDAYSRDDIQQ